MGRGGDGDTGVKVGCCLCLVITIVTAILVGVSFNKLGPNELGLDYSANSLTIDYDKLYTGGVHFLGVGHSFIIFPKNVQEIDMQSSVESIVARTLDGLEVKIQSRVLFRLVGEKDALASLYLKFKDDYITPYRVICRGVVRDVAANFTAFDFWTKRETIQGSIEAELAHRLQDVHAEVTSFLLANFELPARFQESIYETDARREEFETVEFNMQREVKNIASRQAQAEEEVRIIELEARTTAQALQNTFAARAFDIAQITNAEVASYTALKEKLGLTSQQLVDLVWLNTLKENPDTPTLYQVEVPSAIKL